MIDIYIDGNVWNFVHDLKIDLIHEFPRNEFNLLQTKEAEIEVLAIPESSLQRKELKKFIINEIDRCNVQTVPLFGFDCEGTPDHLRRYGGFDNSIWVTPEIKQFKEIEKPNYETTKGSGLFSNEADISLAARSTSLLVLSLDPKKGPLKRASLKNSNIVFLNEFKNSGKSLRNYVLCKDS